MRGIVTLGFLARIEAVLRERHGRAPRSTTSASRPALTRTLTQAWHDVGPWKM